MSDRYRRNEPLDAFSADGEVLLLLEPDRVVRLSPIATAIFELTRQSTPKEALAAELEERFGCPADGEMETALKSVIDDLVAVGVLERVDGV